MCPTTRAYCPATPVYFVRIQKLRTFRSSLAERNLRVTGDPCDAILAFHPFDVDFKV